MGKALLCLVLVGLVGLGHAQTKRKTRQNLFGGAISAPGVDFNVNLQGTNGGLPLPTPNVNVQLNQRRLPVQPQNLPVQPSLPVQPAVQANFNVPTGFAHQNPPAVSFSANLPANPFRLSTRLTPESLLNEEWLAFKLTYNKTYASPEAESFRREVFIENRAKIARLNQEYGEGKRSFVQQLNNFGDLLFNEFNRALNGFNRTQHPAPTGTTFIPSANVILPENMDWRQVGAVTAVKSQGQCAGCWAFAAAGALEGHNFRKTGILNDLSPQNLLDCTRPQGNNGCKGGNTNPAFEYVRDNPGIDTEPAYPYEGQDGECRFRPEAVGGECTGYVDIAEGDEKGLEIAVATIGPVAVAIDASRDTLQFYSDGVYFDPECKSEVENMNHAVLVVGFGQEPDGQKYWMVKNSYGPQWGIGGYIKMAKDRGNHCGIASAASYPLV